MRFVVEAAERKPIAFATEVTKWRYVVFTGPRCKGLLSRTTYKNSDSAYKAGQRMLDKLEK